MLFNFSRAKSALHRIVAGNGRWALFAALVVVLLAQRCLVLERFAFRYTDHDQVLMWYAATEYAHLRVHEPRFYGQNYNTMLEAAFAAPLVLVGVAHARALPLVTSALALSPFVLLGLFAMRRRLPLTAVACLALPLTLPLRYHLVTSMPRGFVTGAFVACLGVLVGLGANTLGRAFLFGLLAAASISVLPNALVMVVPAAVYIGLQKRREAPWLAFAAVGAGVAGLVHAAVQYFYRVHPAASFLSGDDASGPGSLFASDTLGRLAAGLMAPERFLGDVLPSVLAGPYGSLAAIIAPTCLLWLARNYAAAAASLAGGCVVLLAFGLEKVHGGSASIFYPWSRHFLPLPLVLLLYLLWWEADRGQAGRTWVGGWMGAALAVCAASVVAGQWASIDEDVTREAAVPQRHVIPAMTEVLYRNCQLLEIDVRTTHAPMVLFPLSSSLPMNYACPAVLPEPPATLCPEYDRRTWLFETALVSRPRDLLLYDFDWAVTERAMRRLTDVKFIRSRPDVVLVGVDDRSLGEVLRTLRIKVRPH